MTVPMSPLLKTAIWAVVAPLILYIVFLGLGATPFFQRQYAPTLRLSSGRCSHHNHSFLYAHSINTLWWRDINEPERFGFASESPDLECDTRLTHLSWSGDAILPQDARWSGPLLLARHPSTAVPPT